MTTRPDYVYVASSWRCAVQPVVVATLRAAGIDCYDFRNPDDQTGFSWREVKADDDPEGITHCENCRKPVAFSSFQGLGFWEPDLDRDPVIWRHTATGYAACSFGGGMAEFPAPKKGSDHETVETYLRMIQHPRAVEGFTADFAAMEKADVFVLVLPCGRSAHLELGWAIGAGKRTAILLEDPIEPELMYRMVDCLAPSMLDLLGWLGVDA